MTRSRLPWVFRITAAWLVAAIVIGGWWQPQTAGPHGRAFLAAVARSCPAAGVHGASPTIADTAHALDRWASMIIADLLLRGRPRHCTTGVFW